MPPPGDKRTLSASGKSAAALPEVADISLKSSSEVFLMGHRLVTVAGREQGWGRWDGRRAERKSLWYCFWA